eukprot:gene14114-18938_t
MIFQNSLIALMQLLKTSALVINTIFVDILNVLNYILHLDGLLIFFVGFDTYDIHNYLFNYPNHFLSNIVLLNSLTKLFLKEFFHASGSKYYWLKILQSLVESDYIGNLMGISFAVLFCTLVKLTSHMEIYRFNKYSSKAKLNDAYNDKTMLDNNSFYSNSLPSTPINKINKLRVINKNLSGDSNDSSNGIYFPNKSMSMSSDTAPYQAPYSSPNATATPFSFVSALTTDSLDSFNSIDRQLFKSSDELSRVGSSSNGLYYRSSEVDSYSQMSRSSVGNTLVENDVIIRKSVLDPRVLIGWRVLVKGYGIGLILSIQRFNFSSTKFVIQFENGTTLALPLKRSQTKGKIPFSVVSKFR